MNAKVGKEIWAVIAVGTCGLHDDSSDNRTCPLNYAVRQCIVIGGHYSDTETYIKEHGMDLMIETINHIDRVMNNQRNRGDTDQTYWVSDVTEAMTLICITI